MSQIKQTLAPHSKEAEMMALGSMLTSIHALNNAAESLEDSDFYYTEHKIIFLILKTAYKRDKPVDVHLVCEELKRQDKLKAVGGAAYVTTLAQYAGTSAYIEEYVELVRHKRANREIIRIGQLAEKKALDDPDDPHSLIEEIQENLKLVQHRYGKNIPIISPQDRLNKENEFLKTYRGKKYLGLCVETIEEFNENFLGLRGLNLLAAAPNVGKTALTVQIALEVLSSEPNACLVYVSLEMSEEQIFRRMLLNISRLDFRTFVFGSERKLSIEKPQHDFFFKPDEWESIKYAEEKLIGFDNRLQIIDQSSCPYIDAKTVINLVDKIKTKTKCSRALVVIDYLQVWPLHSGLKLHSENEADKWRIGEMKKIRDAMKDDPVIVISESRKPSGKDEAWGGDLSDVMGSARGTYTPDVVMLFSQLNPEAIMKYWKEKKMPSLFSEGENEIISFLANRGISICKLKVPKCRDGMKRFEILLAFHFQKNKFTYVDWNEIKKLATQI